MEVGKAHIVKKEASSQSNTGSSKQNKTSSIFDQPSRTVIHKTDNKDSIFDQPSRTVNGLPITKSHQTTQLTNDEKQELLKKANSDPLNRDKILKSLETDIYNNESKENIFAKNGIALNNNDQVEKTTDDKSKERTVKPDNKLEMNGKIDYFKQGDDTGDCWLLSGTQAVSNTKDGAEIIKNAISQDKNGNVTVTLNGVNKKYTFTPDEINKAESKLCEKDDDMRAIELAVEAHRKEEIESGKDKKHSLADPLDGGLPEEAVYLLTGEKSKYVANPTDLAKENTTQKIFNTITNAFGPQSQNDYLNMIENNPEKYSAAVSFKKDDPVHHIYSDHTFVVKRVEDDNIILTNPWKSSLDIPVTRDRLLDQNNGIVFINV